MNEQTYSSSQSKSDLDVIEPGDVEAPQPSQQASKTQGIETYGSFMIDDREFALPVGVVHEVVNEPSVTSPVPLSPSYMIGLFNLRGMIVPMIDLREIFGFPPSEELGKRKVAIIEDGEMLVGLVFDKTGEVIHARSADRITFRSNKNGIRDVISEGVLKLDGGDRILQILDPYEVLQLEKVPRISKDVSSAESKFARGRRKNCISFEVGHSTYAFDLEHVQEVMEAPEITKSVLTQGHVLGTTNLRGRIVTVVDFRGFVGKQQTDSQQVSSSQSSKLLIMNILEGKIGLLVYAIKDIISYYQEDVLPVSKLAMPHEAIFQGCLAVENRDLVMLFDYEETMRQPDLVAAAQCCQEVHPDRVVDELDENSASSHRRTFITFTAESRFAMDISQVREVIELPKDLMTPPSSPASVAGLFNLRDEIITLFDLRILHDNPASANGSQKVVIFQRDAKKYGILVDSVDEIIMTTADKVLPCQPHMKQSAGAVEGEGASEMVQISTGKDTSKSILILNVDTFAGQQVNF